MGGMDLNTALNTPMLVKHELLPRPVLFRSKYTFLNVISALTIFYNNMLHLAFPTKPMKIFIIIFN